ncbi:Mediator complex, subunit Med7 [Prunus dulcis]|uniref:Mediator of RNA polymerase II transcription subunit 7 n=1 Tax=Prunus dulcis TaxID=3755 RepID=A0A5H2XLU4_PRUDU|nr:Mediator complex, subunit Med7 [Prunus dulcis]
MNELRSLNRELQLHILELADILVERPSQYARTVEDISLIFKNPSSSQLIASPSNCNELKYFYNIGVERNMVSPIKLMIAEEEKFQEKALSLYTSDKFLHITEHSYHFCSIGTFLTGKFWRLAVACAVPISTSTPNHDPTSSGSEAESNDPLDKISVVKHDLQYLSKATD